MSSGLSKFSGKNYGGAEKNAWGLELLLARTAGAERVKAEFPLFHEVHHSQ